MLGSNTINTTNWLSGHLMAWHELILHSGPLSRWLGCFTDLFIWDLHVTIMAEGRLQQQVFIFTWTFAQCVQLCLLLGQLLLLHFGLSCEMILGYNCINCIPLLNGIILHRNLCISDPLCLVSF